MSGEDARIIVILGLAAVVVSYARVLFTTFRNVAIASGVLPDTSRGVASAWRAWISRLPAAEREIPSNVTYVNFWPRLRPVAARNRYRPAVWSVISMVLVIALAICLVPLNYVPASTDTFVTKASDWKSRQLEDGSVVLLGPDTTLRISFTDQRREVHLVRGGTMFDVVTDIKRPFVVYAFSASIIAAADSKFAVTVDKALDLDVYEGMVMVSRRGAKEGATVRMLRAGQSLRIPVDRGSPANRSNVLASAIRLSQPLGS